MTTIESGGAPVRVPYLPKVGIRRIPVPSDDQAIGVIPWTKEANLRHARNDWTTFIQRWDVLTLGIKTYEIRTV